MRAIENNPEGAIYTTPVEKCKTRKPTEREKYYIQLYGTDTQLNMKVG